MQWERGSQFSSHHVGRTADPPTHSNRACLSSARELLSRAYSMVCRQKHGAEKDTGGEETGGDEGNCFQARLRDDQATGLRTTAPRARWGGEGEGYRKGMNEGGPRPPELDAVRRQEGGKGGIDETVVKRDTHVRS